MVGIRLLKCKNGQHWMIKIQDLVIGKATDYSGLMVMQSGWELRCLLQKQGLDFQRDFLDGLAHFGGLMLKCPFCISYPKRMNRNSIVLLDSRDEKQATKQKTTSSVFHMVLKPILIVIHHNSGGYRAWRNSTGILT